MSSVNSSIGFMQGRLCDQVGEKIQAFPARDWESEFQVASVIDLHIMEWTLDQDCLYQNPLMTLNGQNKIKMLCNQFNVSIPSLTGDCFMQAPFWKANGQTRADLQVDFLSIVEACAKIGIRMIVVPLVDNGRLETREQEDILVEFFLGQQAFLAGHSLQLLFESDFTPDELARFIGRFPRDNFGINYDTGNSAAFGFNPIEEFAAFGQRVANIHIKDRVRGGSTVPLLDGDTDFDAVFLSLLRQGYQGNFILQTARPVGRNHDEVLANYRDMTKQWIKEHGILEKC